MYYFDQFISPLKLYEKGLELPDNDLKKRVMGRTKFIFFNQICEIKEGRILTSTIIQTHSGEKYFIHPKLEKVPIETIITYWEKQLQR